MPGCGWKKIYHLLIPITPTTSPVAVRQNTSAVDCQRHTAQYSVGFTLIQPHYSNVAHHLFRLNQDGQITHQWSKTTECAPLSVFPFYLYLFLSLTPSSMFTFSKQHRCRRSQTADGAVCCTVMSEHFPINILTDSH